jgi:hypothetical protein
MPETNAKTTAILEQVAPPSPYWVAIVYRPKKEQQQLEDIEDVDSQEFRKPLPTYQRQIMLPPESLGNNSYNSPDWIELRPGANIQILWSDWQRALKMPIVKALVGLSIDVAATSTIESDYPSYSNFTSAEAIKLVKATTAIAWIDEWMKGENRPEVIRTSNERKVFLEKELAKRTS